MLFELDVRRQSTRELRSRNIEPIELAATWETPRYIDEPNALLSQ